MAVSISVSDAMEAMNLRASPTSDQIAQIQPHFDAAVQMIEDFAPDAPSDVQDGALIRLLAFLWEQSDQDDIGLPPRMHNPLFVSGAAGMLGMYRSIAGTG